LTFWKYKLRADIGGG